MPVEVRMTVGHPLVYDADSASKDEDGDLNVVKDGRFVGCVKDGQWISWEAFEEVYEDDDQGEELLGLDAGQGQSEDD